MSASLFYSDMSNIPENYLVYIEAKKKFGELQKNDVIYIGMYKYDAIKVYEVKLKDINFIHQKIILCIYHWIIKISRKQHSVLKMVVDGLDKDIVIQLN